MAQQKKYVSEYFSFTRKERTGIIVVIGLILFFILLPFLFPFFNNPKHVDHTAFEKEIAALEVKEDSGTTSTKRYNDNDYEVQHYATSDKNYYTSKPKGELFYFDPNSLPVEGWIKLGVKEKTAKTIQKYILKGGKFYKPEDIGKIWGLHKDEVKRLLPYIKIEAKPGSKETPAKTTPAAYTYEKPNFTKTTVDVNAADTSAFIALPGIGSKLANRIIAFREKLGGFYKTDQVAETYGLPDSTFKKIKDKLVTGNNNIKTININTATVDQLKVHPYIRFNVANAIVQFRNAHGNFSTLTDLKKIMIVTEDIYNKAAPYLTVK